MRVADRSRALHALRDEPIVRSKGDCGGSPMRTIDRRNFLRASAAASLLPTLPADLMAQAATSAPPASRWDAGAVRHLLPTVSDNRMLIKASFNAPLNEAPVLRVGG